MKLSDFYRYALTRCVAAALLTGCAAARPLIGAPGATSIRSTVLETAARHRPYHQTFRNDISIFWICHLRHRHHSRPYFRSSG